MPTYQYLCNDCGNGFEIKQSFSDDALTVCPTCQGRLRKVFNAVGVVFKGSGFYRNDSRGASSSSESSTSTSTSDTSSGSSDASGASTPSTSTAGTPAPASASPSPSASTSGSAAASS